MRHYVWLSWQPTHPGKCALRWCTRQLIGNGCGRNSKQRGQRIQSRSTGLKSSMTSCPQMSGYMPSGSRARPPYANCGEHDTVMHRIIECGEGRKIWEWTRNRIAWILRMGPVWIPNEWTIRPKFKLWPPQRHRAVLWILAHMVWFRTRGSWTLSAQEYFDFLRSTLWKANRDTRRATQVGNYLSILKWSRMCELMGAVRQVRVRHQWINERFKHTKAVCQWWLAWTCRLEGAGHPVGESVGRGAWIPTWHDKCILNMLIQIKKSQFQHIFFLNVLYSQTLNYIMQ